MNTESAFPLDLDTASAHLTLDAVVARVAAHPKTVGIVALGSAATGTMTDASDYDLLVVLDDALAPMTLILTRVDQRVAEVVLMASHELRRILTVLPTSSEMSGTVGLARRFAEGRILFDRANMLGQAQATAQQFLPNLSVSDAHRYAAWFSINYSLRMLTPMLPADDASHRFASQYRMHVQISDLCTQYFTIRGLPWRGEKAAYRYWGQHDPEFLALLETFLNASDVRKKAERYRELAGCVLTPIGSVWSESDVVADAPLEQVMTMLERWRDLLSAP